MVLENTYASARLFVDRRPLGVLENESGRAENRGSAHGYRSASANARCMSRLMERHVVIQESENANANVRCDYGHGYDHEPLLCRERSAIHFHADGRVLHGRPHENENDRGGGARPWQTFRIS